MLEQINSPQDLKKLNEKEKKQLAEEIRKYILDVVSENGGHLASNLGVVELTIALHSVFNVPEDKIVWDVGHQSYVHKIITGRREELKNIEIGLFIYNIEKYKQSLEEIVKDEEIYNNQCEEEQKNLDRIKALKEELKNNINNITTQIEEMSNLGFESQKEIET